jgi:hypothetical protein
VHEGDLLDSVKLPPGGTLIYTVRGTLTDIHPFFNTACADLPDIVQDPNPDNNCSTAENHPYLFYLPVTLKSPIFWRPFPPNAPDLMIDDLIVSQNNVTVIISNRGVQTVTQSFWVDVYIDPWPVPYHPDETWERLCDYGMAWGVTGDALPLYPGEVLTLTVGDAYYFSSFSRVQWPLELDRMVFVQVDSYGADNPFGAVVETHEIKEDFYNNIQGPVYPAVIEGEGPPLIDGDPPLQDLPRRE